MFFVFFIEFSCFCLFLLCWKGGGALVGRREVQADAIISCPWLCTHGWTSRWGNSMAMAAVWPMGGGHEPSPLRMRAPRCAFRSSEGSVVQFYFPMTHFGSLPKCSRADNSLETKNILMRLGTESLTIHLPNLSKADPHSINTQLTLLIPHFSLYVKHILLILMRNHLCSNSF